MKGFLDYRSGKWISSREIGDSVGLDWNNVAGMLGAFGTPLAQPLPAAEERWFLPALDSS